MAISFVGAVILIWISTSIWKVKTLDAGKQYIDQDEVWKHGVY